MQNLPSDWTALAGVVLLLGLKHGFDADHLATIDGLTRCNARAGNAFARFCGALFSLGHGLVVLAIALAVGALSRSWQTPGWLEVSGAWISIGFLTLLGVLNLHAVLAADPDQVVAPVGLKGRWLGRLVAVEHPALVLLVGAMFALSFDTISQAALFALAATHFGGIGHAAALGLLFTTGMVATDAVNGMWIARLIARADALARIASRVMSLAVAAVSLLVAALGAARYLSPVIDSWSEGRQLWLGAGVLSTVTLSAAVAGIWAQQRSRPRVLSPLPQCE
jgi:high-affinity nickel-transport protein